MQRKCFSLALSLVERAHQKGRFSTSFLADHKTTYLKRETAAKPLGPVQSRCLFLLSADSDYSIHASGHHDSMTRLYISIGRGTPKKPLPGGAIFSRGSQAMNFPLVCYHSLGILELGHSTPLPATPKVKLWRLLVMAS